MAVSSELLSALSTLRVGQGFDIHKFSDDPNRRLVLGGVHFEGVRGLDGHSDADAIAHAVTDALLSAAALGDIGEHFPDTDPQWKGADSMKMLGAVVGLVRGEGFEIVNVDCTVIAETPKLSPRKPEIVANLVGVVGAPVTVKGRRAEGLGTLGRREGIAALAVVLLVGARLSAQGTEVHDG
jgi:2-C-methyl-D-erythritol 2,4-cyclodiphosphate synthase